MTPAASRRTQRRYFVLPVCLLMLNVLEELFIYMVPEIVPNPWWRITVIIAMFLVGFAAVGFWIAPAMERWIGRMHSAGRKTAGWLGELLIVVAIGAAMFGIYYLLYIQGPKSLLPAFLE